MGLAVGNQRLTTSLIRLPNWRGRFEAVFDDIMTRPFEWQVHDCGPGLAGRTVLALTGVDLCSQYAGDYHDLASAVRLVRSLGHETLGGLVGSMLPQIHPSHARLGDIAAIEVKSPLGHALGVVNGERIYVLTEMGVGTRDLLDAAMCFKVG
jgi:hypothetical protein